MMQATMLVQVVMQMIGDGFLSTLKKTLVIVP